jgi:adenine-specific DNA-methyltransferase
MGGQGDSRDARPNLYFELTDPDGDLVYPKRQDGSDGAWRWSKEKIAREHFRIQWVKGRNGWTPYFRIYGDSHKGRPAETIWQHSEVGSNRTSKFEVKSLFPEQIPFSTPKPEKLLNRIIHVATNQNDWVLDSFLGSGTTAAVAHKMNRRWIGIELGDHCHTHCLPRLKQVVDGTDQGGISNAENWQGGGGFKYYYLAPSLLKKDKYDNWIIDEQYNADMLAAAMAKHEGFKFSPDESVYWKQGRSTEKDYIFTTTNFITVKELDRIHGDMKPDESLLICCKSFSKACADRYANITVKKIPNMLLGRCEFGKEDYSLNIVSMPVDPDEPEFVPKGPQAENRKKTKNTPEQSELALFNIEDDD